jgi:hypothetical protein
MVDLNFTCYWFLFEIILGLLFNDSIACIGLILMNADTGMLFCTSCEIDFEMAHWLTDAVAILVVRSISPGFVCVCSSTTLPSTCPLRRPCLHKTRWASLTPSIASCVCLLLCFRLLLRLTLHIPVMFVLLSLKCCYYILFCCTWKINSFKFYTTIVIAFGYCCFLRVPIPDDNWKLPEEAG